MGDKKLQTRILDKKCAYDFNDKGVFVVNEYRIEAEKHDGTRQVFPSVVFERGDAVAMLAYDPVRDEVLMGVEMRRGIAVRGEDSYVPALLAGMIDAGEDALQAADREMREESGQGLRDPEMIHAGAYASPGGCTEKIAIVFTLADTSALGVHGKESEGESIKNIAVPAADFIRDYASLADLKTVAAALWLAANRDRLKEKYAPANKNRNDGNRPSI